MLQVERNISFGTFINLSKKACGILIFLVSIAFMNIKVISYVLLDDSHAMTVIEDFDNPEEEGEKEKEDKKEKNTDDYTQYIAASNVDCNFRAHLIACGDTNWDDVFSDSLTPPPELI